MPDAAQRKLVGVFPASARRRRRLLFDALEEAFPVRFAPRNEGERRGLDSALELEGSRQAEIASTEMPALSLGESERARPHESADVILSESPCLDAKLRAAVLRDAHLPARVRRGAELAAPEFDPRGATEIIARAGATPLWVRSGSLQRSALSPRELDPGEALRDRIGDGRSLALLPLVHMLSELTRDIRWQPPAPRASLLLDDPNLHWPTYGFVDLERVAVHARETGYHMALATVPLDYWFAHPRAVRALRESERSLSLLVHGNDHLGGELGRPESVAQAVTLASQALRRVEALERRTAIPVDRVMAPPHEACSEETTRGLLRCGFEAISMTQPFPWAADRGSWLDHSGDAGPLVGWRAADLVGGGLPVLLRHPLRQRSSSEIALRAFLGQPLILYGHHGDLDEGLELLERAVDTVNEASRPRWSSLGEIAASSYESRREGRALHVRLLSRRARIEIPSEVDELTVELPSSHTEPDRERLLVNGRAVQLAGRAGEPVTVGAGGTVSACLQRLDAVDHHAVPSPRPRPLAIGRRLAGESRDRLMPLVGRLRR